MTSVPPESIISGVDYAVRANGRPPQRDGDFDGEISLSLCTALADRPSTTSTRFRAWAWCATAASS